MKSTFKTFIIKRKKHPLQYIYHAVLIIIKINVRTRRTHMIQSTTVVTNLGRGEGEVWEVFSTTAAVTETTGDQKARITIIIIK